MKIYDTLPHIYTMMQGNTICQNANGTTLLTIVRYTPEEWAELLGIHQIDGPFYEVYIFTHTPGSDQDPIFTCTSYDTLYTWYQNYRGLDAPVG